MKEKVEAICYGYKDTIAVEDPTIGMISQQ